MFPATVQTRFFAACSDAVHAEVWAPVVNPGGRLSATCEAPVIDDGCPGACATAAGAATRHDLVEPGGTAVAGAQRAVVVTLVAALAGRSPCALQLGSESLLHCRCLNVCSTRVWLICCRALMWPAGSSLCARYPARQGRRDGRQSACCAPQKPASSWLRRRPLSQHWPVGKNLCWAAPCRRRRRGACYCPTLLEPEYRATT